MYDRAYFWKSDADAATISARRNAKYRLPCVMSAANFRLEKVDSRKKQKKIANETRKPIMPSSHL